MKESIETEIQQFLVGRGASFRYQLLSRMQSDCCYYLGNGRRYGNHLWAGDENRQIAYMKALWHSFPPDAKPEWLTLEGILAYERRLDPRYKLQQDTLNRIADRLGVVAWYPAYHADPMEKNPVLFYMQASYEQNQKIGQEPGNFMAFYHKPEQDIFLKPFLVYENTDSSGNMSYDFACDGQIDLCSEDWETRLLDYIQQAYNIFLQRAGKL